MIKNFKEYINEDYFSKLASRKDNVNVRKEQELTEDIVRSYVSKDFKEDIESISFRRENGETIVDIVGNFYLDEESETIPFQFGKITGSFYCSWCYKLKSLKGCPKEVTKGFNCSNCENLESLEGCPEIAGESFDCRRCPKLKSLEGCPKEVGLYFNCGYCGKKFTKEEVKSLCTFTRKYARIEI